MSTEPATESTQVVESSLLDGITVAPNAIESIARAEIDIQIATAKRYPRSLAKFHRDAIDMATVSEEVAASLEYQLSRRSGEGGKSKIIGPSVRLAEIVAACFGNIRVSSQFIGYVDDGKAVLVRATAHDLERNNFCSREVVRPCVRSDGKTRYSRDMLVVTINAAAAIAMRNAIFAVVPRSLLSPIIDAAHKLLAGDEKSLAAKRAAMLKHFASLGVTEQRLCGALGYDGIADIGADGLLELRRIATSIRDGEQNVAELFPVEARSIADAVKQGADRLRDATTKGEPDASSPFKS